MSDTTQPVEDDFVPTLPAWVTGAKPQAVPTQVGPFKVLEKIGAGGAGEVWAAYDQALDRRVALKLVRRRSVADEHETRLLREAHALAKLSHPNVVTVHDADRTQDYVYIAMELVGGGTLKSAFADPGHGPVARMGWLLQAARGLQAAHELGLVHRDFKPANALLGVDGRVRVADFGLARLADSKHQPAHTLESPDAPTPKEALDSTFSDLTVTGAILGTPAYMSPEQRLGQRVGPSSDQFSFCVVAWQALFGTNPLAELNLAQWIAGDDSLPPAPSVPGIPAAVQAVLRRGLQPSPDERHPSMLPLLQAFESATRPRRRWGTLAIAGLVAVVAVGAAAVLSSPPGEEDCAVRPLGWAGLRHATTVRALADGSAAGHTAATVAALGLQDFASSWTKRARSHCDSARDLPSPCLERQRAVYERTAAVLQQAGARQSVPEVLATMHPECSETGEQEEPLWIQAAQLWPELAAGNAAEVLAGSAQIAEATAEHPQRPSPRLQAEHLRLKGAAHAKWGDAHLAVETLRVAYNVAERGDLDDVAAAVAADLARLTALDLDQPDRGRVWLRSAESLSSVTPRVHADIAFTRGLLAAKDARWRAAADAFARSAELQEHAPVYTDGPAEAWVRRAQALARAGEVDEARRWSSQALERRRRLYGDAHPKVLAVHTLEASLQSL